MKIKKVKGIILTETNYSESSKILNVLTEEHGLIGFISKGCRKVKSKLRAISSPLVYGTFDIYYKEDGLSTLIDGNIINSFDNIKKDLTSLSYSAYLLDLTNQVVKQSEESNLLDILIPSLERINEGLNPQAITCILELKYLDYLGVMLELDSCAICGDQENIITIDASYGGYICSNCLTDQKIVSDHVIKLLRMFYYVDINKLTKLDIKDDTLKVINDFLEDYYERYTGIYLKSKNFINSIKKIDS